MRWCAHRPMRQSGGGPETTCDVIERATISSWATQLIAATAVAHSAMLWTRNRKHYPMKELLFFD